MPSCCNVGIVLPQTLFPGLNGHIVQHLREALHQTCQFAHLLAGLFENFQQLDAGTGSGNEDDPKYVKIKEHIPADRWGERQDLMGAMVFLASKAADYVNGTLLVVDGGYLVR